MSPSGMNLIDREYKRIAATWVRDVKEEVQVWKEAPDPTVNLDDVERNNTFYDLVDNVKHYKLFDGTKETIDLIRDRLSDVEFKGYCLGNIIKYNMRCKEKGKLEEDLRKMKTYIQYYLGER